MELAGSDATIAASEWQGQLELKPGDPAAAKLATISKMFAGSTLPVEDFPPEQRDEVLSGEQQSREPALGPRKAHEGTHFKYGIDYFFGKYQGKPQSVKQNAVAAIYQRRQGVELWRIMKSVALAIPNKKIIIAHVRGDRKIDEEALARVLEIEKTDLKRADVNLLGVEYGTVNPFIEQKVVSVSHIFDLDLIEGSDYPNDDIVFTSSGDPRFYVGFDVRRYLMAIPEPKRWISDITENQLETPRFIARRKVIVIGGDSGIDTFDFSKMILNGLRQTLEKSEAYYGDRSLAQIDAISDPGLGGSIDTALYGKQLRARVVKIVTQLQNISEQQKPPPIISFSSMAMHGVAGEMLRDMEGIEYIGPREALNKILAELKKLNVEIAHTALLGLSSAYDKERSAFAGEVLGSVLPVDENVMRQIQKFVHDCKTDRADPEEFYETIKKILQRAARGKIDTLINKNITIILGASELEIFVSGDDKTREMFAIIKSNNPASIATEIAKASDKIRLIFIRPGRAVAELIAQKTLGLEDR
jgi:prolyl-tRNA editing enzyme YbaK/EbsC (Cys-tRNA(Pro) deacylase)